MALNGLVAITLAITYILRVLSAVIAARQLGCQISVLGDSPKEILVRSFDGQGCGPLETWLPDLLPGLLKLAQNQLAFPVLHTFRSLTPDAAAPARAALLAEVVLLLRAGVAPEVRLAGALTGPLDRALDQLIRTMVPDLVRPAEPPPGSDLGALRGAGIPVVEAHAWQAALASEEDRRRRLYAMVRLDGWTWREIVGGGPDERAQVGG